MADAPVPAPVPEAPLEARQRTTHTCLQRLLAAVAQGDAERTRLGLKGLSLALAAQWRVEEQVMDAEGYPGAANHQRLHQELLRLFAGARTERPGSIRDLARAVDEHLLNADVKILRFRDARGSLQRLATAVPDEGPLATSGPSGEPQERPRPAAPDRPPRKNE